MEQAHLATEECLTPVQLRDGELPFACVLILDDEEDAIFAGVMQTFGVRGLRIDKAPLLGGSSVSLELFAILVLDDMRRIVVDVHATCIWVLREAVLIELGDFVQFFDVLARIAVIFTHMVSALLHEVEGIVSHVQEYGRALDHKTYINSHQVSAEDVELSGIVVNTFPIGCPTLLQFLSQLGDVLLFQLTFIFGHAAFIKTELVVELLFHLEHFVDVVNNLVGNGLICRVDDRDVSRLLIVSHVGSLVVELLVVGEHPQKVDFPLQLRVHPVQLLDIVVEMAYH